jgi:histidyl-tRNA synthetase
MHAVETLPLVVPRLSRGLHDHLPAQMLARQELIDTIRGVYELYGFVPLGTPAIEYTDVLFGSAGTEAEQTTFQVVSPEREPLGLRYDLTVPLARVIAQHPELPLPFRRYQVAPVWRADKPDPGRFREFVQFDLDSVGVPSEIADTEIIAAMCDTLSKLLGGLGYVVRISSRGILQLLLPFAGIDPHHGDAVFRAIDKIDRVGLHNVRRELMEGYQDASGDRIAGAGLTSDQVDRIEAFIGVQSEHRGTLLSMLRDLFAHIAGAEEQIDKLDRVSRHLYNLGYGDDHVVIDLSIARGLAYYTGPIFEAHLLDAPHFGAVFSGGRYDYLTRRYLGKSTPATGASIGVDRLLAALTHLKAIESRSATAQVLVTAVDPSLADDYLDMTWRLRRAGIPTELYLGEAASLGKQLKYADRCGVPLAILYGSQEKESGVVSIKNLAEGKRRAQDIHHREAWLASPSQISVARDQLVDAVKQLLGN